MRLQGWTFAAGVVASFALVINFLLTVAAMILIKAAFTLT